jgi:hypothetical protein
MNQLFYLFIYFFGGGGRVAEILYFFNSLEKLLFTLELKLLQSQTKEKRRK